MLLNSKKYLKCKILTLKCFSKMAERELADVRSSNAQKCCEKKVTKRDHVVASIRQHRARFLKYCPRPPCASSLVKARMPLPLETHFLLIQSTRIKNSYCSLSL